MRIKERIQNWKMFLSEGIWDVNYENLSRMRAHLVKDLQVLIITIKTF